MKLEVGKYYRTRDGRKIGPLYEKWPDDEDGDTWGHVGGGELWNHIGRHWDSRKSDLIAEWTNEPHMVLENGSTIMFSGSSDDPPMRSFTNHEFDVYPMGVQDIEPVTVGDRASTTPSPIRTVTRKEIVPGVYGNVWVDANVSGGFNVGFKSYSTTTADLTAAIETLTAIREALS